ncbi:unnamed protein product [Cuscuta europaea]|uniref:BRX domain-containing protein n=2 Tax=Cuscuta europaea TaxID=41803 RepID=A0A9P1E9U8_CUSEU|nr:unnamed protein product [Cuscuta europaea]
MLTCIACSKQLNTGSLHEPDEDDAVTTPSTRQAIKTLTAQIKDIAVKASGAYKQCSNPCSKGSNIDQSRRNYADSDAGSVSERVHCAYRRTRSSNSTPRIWGKGPEAGGYLSGGEGTPASASGRTESGELTEEGEGKEWVAQVEPGVLITFVPLPNNGGNGLKRIQFSREMFNKGLAQRWWAENYDKVMELYNVQMLNRQAAPMSAVENSKVEYEEGSPMAPPLSKVHPRLHLRRPTGMSHCSSESLGHDSVHSHYHPTPMLSSIKTETASIDASERSSCQSLSNGGGSDDMESEWVEEDVPGVYITIRALPGGSRELRRVRFSREIFGEVHARLWWEENRARIQQQYL